MSRLYLKAQADNGKVFTKTADGKFYFEVLWGGREDSKLAAEIEVTWPKQQLLPKIRVKHPVSITLENEVR
jgi:hypothetical protein